MRGAEAVVVKSTGALETGQDGEQPRQPAGRGEPGSGHKQWKKFLYCEPHKRIKEVLEEELYIKRDECHIKNPPAVALEGVWSIKRNFPVGGLMSGELSRNSLLPQAKYYSRHGGLRSQRHQRGSPRLCWLVPVAFRASSSSVARGRREVLKEADSILLGFAKKAQPRACLPSVPALSHPWTRSEMSGTLTQEGERSDLRAGSRDAACCLE
ncbi:PREDICTED: uncharacterized protein LOC102827569 [Chrysochloris asiatica]|uniref:Uncharacterized protein LOC102827569 n=1 Tax=Chrysochloris asiatica TaxID=185453 RepID=A0A9B0WIA6_CHRAS|nr:PREDICTED: uncharacterized protein LOC102827569 [Chrysochloris asiatica]